MKTTIDLPETLVRSLKLQAIHDRKTLQMLATELLRAAAMPPSSRAAKPSPKPRRGKMALPFFPCAPDAPARHMSIGQLLALEQESQNQEDRARLGLSH